MKIVIVGAGVSGMLAASILRHKHEVILIEKNDACGKKILKTGNGKCNFWHTNLRTMFYEADDEEKLDKILMNQEDALSYLLSLGIYPVIKDGYYYPRSKEASSIRDILVNNLDGVKLFLNEEVLDIKKKDNSFIVKTNKKEIACDKVIMASGSKASVKECNSYDILSKYHTVIPVLPALVKLKCNNEYLTIWDGVRSDAYLTVYVNDDNKLESYGEIQLAKDGISGICVFDISGYVNKCLNKKLEPVVSINFFPLKDLRDFLKERSLVINKPIKELLDSVFNKKLIKVFLLKSKIDGNKLYNDLSSSEQERLIDTITDFRVNITDSNGFINAQVCTGGIPLSEINESTMESLKVDGLYLTGELLDVDGVCGGYNMSFAFITGYLAALAIGEEHD